MPRFARGHPEREPGLAIDKLRRHRESDHESAAEVATLVAEAEAVTLMGDLDAKLALPPDLLFLDADRLLHLKDVGEVGVEQEPQR